MIIRKKAQSSVEYAILVIIVLGAMVAGGIYFKRGLQGRWKSAVDEVGDQYDPAYMNTRVTHYLVANSQTSIWAIMTGGNDYWTFREDISNSLDTDSGYMKVGTRP